MKKLGASKTPWTVVMSLSALTCIFTPSMRTERSSVGAAFCALCLFSCSSKPSRGAAWPPSSFCFLSGASSSDIAEENGERKKAGARKCRRQRHLKADFTRDTPEIFSEHLQAKRSVSKVVGLSEFSTLGLTGIRKSRCARSRHDARMEAPSSAASNHTHTHTHTHTRGLSGVRRAVVSCASTVRLRLLALLRWPLLLAALFATAATATARGLRQGIARVFYSSTSWRATRARRFPTRLRVW